MTVAWLVFAADYLVRFCLAGAGGRVRFVKRNLLDLAVVVLPLLRPLRLIRLLALVSILNRTGVHRLRGRVITYAVGGTAMLITLGALTMTDAEANAPGTHIHDIGDGLWWALTTITTVGYGDTYPVTETGRMIAASLMIGGVALLGVVTGTFASWLVERMSEAAEVEQAATRAQVDELRAELAHVRGTLDRLVAASERREAE